MLRRNFLRALLAAPIAAPVAAKEAAAKIGLKGALGGALGGGSSGFAHSGETPMPIGDGNDWMTQQLTDMATDEGKRRSREMARDDARRLDPDLAALRSVSPAWAYQRQIERCYERSRANQRSWLNFERAKQLGRKLLS